jgi:putative NADH-flavin reductase
MKIALLGASGKTGRHFLEKALAAGHEVQVLVRRPELFHYPSSPQLQVIPGDVLNQQDVNQVVAGTSLVVSLFGHVKDSPAWLQTRGTEHLAHAMKQHGVERIISLSGGGLPFPEKDQPGLPDHLIRWVMKTFFAKVLNDAIRHAEVLRQSGLQWVIVRGPRLTEGPEKGQYRTGWVGVNASTQISRADLAHFLLRLVHDRQYDGTMPFVSY